MHYIKHHGYVPKLANKAIDDDSRTSGPVTDLLLDGEDLDLDQDLLECSSCTRAKFCNQHLLIKHLLKDHCSYSGLICPYCRGAFPQRFIDLQNHVTSKHMDQVRISLVDWYFFLPPEIEYFFVVISNLDASF